MKTRGAGEIARQATRALASAAQAYSGSGVPGFRSELVAAARLLAGARPTAVSLRNGLNFVLVDALAKRSVAEGKQAALRRAGEFDARVTAAKERIAKEGAALLRRGDVVLTHCHSTAAAGALIEADRRGKKIRVFSTETRPFRQGLITSRALSRAGVDVTLIVDSAALHVMETQGVAAMVIGADTIDAQGGLYNKVGTRMITLAAKSLNIPVYVCAESYKFSPYAGSANDVEIEERGSAEIVAPAELPGVRVHNPVFDRTPPSQVTTYVTERGLVAPRAVAGFIRREFGGVRRWI